MIPQFMWQEQRRDRLRQPGHVLGNVDQCDRKISRRVEDGQAERTDQHDIAGGGAALLPEHDHPGEQCDGQHQRDAGMDQPQLFKITQTAAPRDELAIDGRVEALMLVGQPAECPHQRHVADDIDHFAVHDRRLVGEIVMQRLAGRGEAEHRNHHGAGDHDHDGRHGQTDGSNQRDRRYRGSARRQHVPHKHVLDREDGIRRRRDPACQHARQAIGEIARRVSRQMTEHVAAEIPGDADEGKARDPARDAPQEVVSCDQRHEKRECQPYAACAIRPAGETIDQRLHTILGADGTRNGADNGDENSEMGRRTLAQIAHHERKRAVRVSGELIHVEANPWSVGDVSPQPPAFPASLNG